LSTLRYFSFRSTLVAITLVSFYGKLLPQYAFAFLSASTLVAPSTGYASGSATHYGASLHYTLFIFYGYFIHSTLHASLLLASPTAGSSVTSLLYGNASQGKSSVVHLILLRRFFFYGTNEKALHGTLHSNSSFTGNAFRNNDTLNTITGLIFSNASGLHRVGLPSRLDPYASAGCLHLLLLRFFPGIRLRLLHSFPSTIKSTSTASVLLLPQSYGVVLLSYAAATSSVTHLTLAPQLLLCILSVIIVTLLRCGFLPYRNSSPSFTSVLHLDGYASTYFVASPLYGNKPFASSSSGSTYATVSRFRLRRLSTSTVHRKTLPQHIRLTFRRRRYAVAAVFARYAASSSLHFTTCFYCSSYHLRPVPYLRLAPLSFIRFLPPLYASGVLRLDRASCLQLCTTVKTTLYVPLHPLLQHCSATLLQTPRLPGYASASLSSMLLPTEQHSYSSSSVSSSVSRFFPSGVAKCLFEKGKHYPLSSRPALTAALQIQGSILEKAHRDETMRS
jgi:hypothetical protein